MCCMQSDHEKQAHRASQATDASGETSGPSWASKEIAALDTGKDFSLKQGETIRSAVWLIAPQSLLVLRDGDNVSL